MTFGVFLGGVIAGVVAAFVWAGIEWVLRRYRNHSNFGHLSGRYCIRPKLGLQSDLGSGQVAQISVSGTILKVTFEGLPEGDSVTGEIAMSEAFPEGGRDSTSTGNQENRSGASGNFR